MNRGFRLKGTIRSSLLLIGAGVSLLLVGVVAAQSQLPGVALTSGPGNDFRPVWSSDGSKIAFFSNRAGENDIWVMNSDGSDQRQLTSGAADDRRPAWSPDGNWVAFDSDRDGTKDIWVVDAGGGDPLPVTREASFDNFPSWSPDGKQIAYFRYEGGVLDIWVVALEDLLQGGQAGQPQRVTTLLADEKQQQCTYACHSPAWSPDGQQIAYNRANHTEVWVVGADGSNPLAVEVDEGHMHFPWWTPEGKLLMLSERSNADQQTVNDIWSLDADGSNLTLLFAGIPHGGPFYWNPADIETIAFHSPREGSFDIYTTKLGEEPSTDIEPAAVAEAATEVVVEEVAGGATAVAAVPEPSTSEAETEGVQTTPARQIGSPWIWVAAVLVLSGISVAVYRLRRGRSDRMRS